ncbi:hypothetical protein R3P38DRAFT_2616021 [Favolaschia claudopus]|uniref:Uncharacterized protein n=1 Tax=Favolaschia claudopus TaxID=2862362 RepID=A0AAW0C9H7_9AGAR
MRRLAPPAISIYDINLQREVYIDNPQLCSWRPRRRNAVRRYHSATVKDQKEMTVVFYEGKNAEDEFKKDVAKYMEFRHPSFLQLYGTAHSADIYANIFYDALIPYRDIVNIYRQSPMMLCYIYTYVAASDYFRGRFGSGLYNTDYTLFLRSSTGRLNIDLEGFHGLLSPFSGTANITSKFFKLFSTLDTQTIIDALTIEQYHTSCDRYFGDTTYTQISLMATAHLGAVYHTNGHHDLGNPVAIAPTLDIDDCLNRAWYLYQVDPQVTESRWNRFAVSELIGRELGEKIELYLSATEPQLDSEVSHLWLSQANHVLNRLGVVSNTDNYALLNEIWFKVEMDPQSATSTAAAGWHSLDAFLFLCPPQSLRVGPVSLKFPECVGYWSLDPLGEDRLSSEQAAELGFPTIHVSVYGRGKTWSDNAYAGLWRFLKGKGFDPNSQDLARHLGVPLYQLYCDYEKSLNVDGGEAHIEELTSSDTDQSVDEEVGGNLSIVQDENRESVSKSGDLEEDLEDIAVSSSLKMLALIQLSLILLIAVLTFYGSL